jgi:hypothetical protein
MRLWTIHPKYLDSKGLVALWREGLLALHVLKGETRGYRNHPQLERFKQQSNSIGAINQYLWSIVDEAESRGYKFDHSKLSPVRINVRIPVTNGQIQFELEHLKRKLRQRDPDRLRCIEQIIIPDLTPIFFLINGEVESWEKLKF